MVWKIVIPIIYAILINSLVIQHFSKVTQYKLVDFCLISIKLGFQLQITLAQSNALDDEQSLSVIQGSQLPTIFLIVFVSMLYIRSKQYQKKSSYLLQISLLCMLVPLLANVFTKLAESKSTFFLWVYPECIKVVFIFLVLLYKGTFPEVKKMSKTEERKQSF